MSIDPIIGIDLGTTNSVAAHLTDGQLHVFEEQGETLLPSCVGIDPAGTLLIGTAARNQAIVYPERTVLSIKRKMGSVDKVTLGDQSFSPPEISALILRALAQRAERHLKTPVKRAVITVPAYFSDAQRQATREAGALADLQIARLLHEPTAASLAFANMPKGATVLVYDLGGGTFDVSIVRVDGEITEVLASHGDTHLGGDDLDELVLQWVAERFRELHDIDLLAEKRAEARVRRACEEARCRLSFVHSVTLREESILQRGNKPLHLEMGITRQHYESLVGPTLRRTLDSVHRALMDAQMTPAKIDFVVLAGGATRTPLVRKLLQQVMGKEPRTDLHPDLCVAEGAAHLASRLEGHDASKILIDISPHTFGVACLGEHGGMLYPYTFKEIIPRTTPLPCSKAELFSTIIDNQASCEIKVFQGENRDALQNILVGTFVVEGLSKQPAGNTISCTMDLDPDGILQVTAVEKVTGLSRHITIENALTVLGAEEISRARERLAAMVGIDPVMFAAEVEASISASENREDDALFDHSDSAELESDFTEESAPDGQRWADGSELESDFTEESAPDGQRWANDSAAESLEQSNTAPPAGEPLVAAKIPAGPPHRGRIAAARALQDRARGLEQRMHPDDRGDASQLVAKMEAAIQAESMDQLDQLSNELADLLFYVEAR